MDQPFHFLQENFSASSHCWSNAVKNPTIPTLTYTPCHKDNKLHGSLPCLVVSSVSLLLSKGTEFEEKSTQLKPAGFCKIASQEKVI
jgi:hypothetical protein